MARWFKTIEFYVIPKIQNCLISYLMILPYDNLSWRRNDLQDDLIP